MCCYESWVLCWRGVFSVLMTFELSPLDRTRTHRIYIFHFPRYGSKNRKRNTQRIVTNFRVFTFHAKNTKFSRRIERSYLISVRVLLMRENIFSVVNQNVCIFIIYKKKISNAMNIDKLNVISTGNWNSVMPNSRDQRKDRGKKCSTKEGNHMQACQYGGWWMNVGTCVNK